MRAVGPGKITGASAKPSPALRQRNDEQKPNAARFQATNEETSDFL
jgi:hypothetical protein